MDRVTFIAVICKSCAVTMKEAESLSAGRNEITAEAESTASPRRGKDGAVVREKAGFLFSRTKIRGSACIRDEDKTD